MAKVKASAWRSRIIGSEDVAPDQLMANPRNWRIHPKAQQDALTGALDQVGWVQRVIVNQQTGNLVDGHLRVELALSRGEPTVPVEYVDLTPEEEGLVLASLDPIAAMAGTDSEKLRMLLAEVEFDSKAFENALRELTGTELSAGMTDPDEVPDAPEDTYVKPGDLWLLGEHRLLCGDSTNPDDVMMLLAGGSPYLCVTDPPYGVNYDPTWRNESLEISDRRSGAVTNDNRADWREAWALAPSSVFYVWHDWLDPGATLDALRSVGIEPRMHIVWAKERPVISRGHYNGQHECCWYGVKAGAVARWVGTHSESSLWRLAGDPTEGGHGTQKPVECMARPMRNHEGDVYEPFSGSGTTIIAAEQLGRRCYAMEIEPRYVQVSIDRWERFTGKKAVKADG